MLHAEYIKHLKKRFTDYIENSSFCKSLQGNKKEFHIIVNINFDAALDLLKSIYCPVKRRPPRDPVCLLRSLILMTVLKIKGITEWVKKMIAIRRKTLFVCDACHRKIHAGTYDGRKLA